MHLQATGSGISAPQQRWRIPRTPIALQRPRPATCTLFAVHRPSRPHAHADTAVGIGWCPPTPSPASAPPSHTSHRQRSFKVPASSHRTIQQQPRHRASRCSLNPNPCTRCDNSSSISNSAINGTGSTSTAPAPAPAPASATSATPATPAQHQHSTSTGNSVARIRIFAPMHLTLPQAASAPQTAADVAAPRIAAPRSSLSPRIGSCCR
jgi:hypothetical protein